MVILYFGPAVATTAFVVVGGYHEEKASDFQLEAFVIIKEITH